MAKLERDVNNAPIQALRPVTSESTKVASGASSAKVALPSGYSIVRLVATENAYINLGDSGVTASSSTDMKIVKDTPEIFVVSGNTHIAAIQDSVAGEVIITPMA